MAFALLIWAGAHFMKPISSVKGNGGLVVIVTEAGVGNDQVTYELTADGSAIFGCINDGGNHPADENKQTVAVSVATGTTAETKNGKVTATLRGAVPTTGTAFCKQRYASSICNENPLAERSSSRTLSKTRTE